MSASTYGENKTLELIVGKTAWSLPTVYVALFTTAPGDSGGGVEVSGNNYQRKSTSGSDWASAGSRQISNANAISFTTPSGDWGVVEAVATFDASSSGNMLDWDWLGAHDYQPFALSDTTNDDIICPSHGYVANDAVICTAEFGGTLPTGLAANTKYYVSSTGLTSNAFRVSATQGGSVVNITTAGNGMVRKVTPATVTSGNPVQLGIGAMILTQK